MTTCREFIESAAALGMILLVMIDLWEHVYCLKFQCKRYAYVATWWNVVCWKNDEKRHVTVARP